MNYGIVVKSSWLIKSNTMNCYLLLFYVSLLVFSSDALVVTKNKNGMKSYDHKLCSTASTTAVTTLNNDDAFVVRREENDNIRSSSSTTTATVSRRDVVTTTTTTTTIIASALLLLLSSPNTAFAAAPAPPKAKKREIIDPALAFAGIKKAREELREGGNRFLKKKDLVGLLKYLKNDCDNLSRFETNTVSILFSNAIDAESKKELGTIRRYGVTADVMIMYGGLISALEGPPPDEQDDYDSSSSSSSSSSSNGNGDPDFAEVQKLFTRCGNSLDDVIAIISSNRYNW